MRESAAEMVAEAADAVEMILSEGVSRAMKRFNRRAPPRKRARFRTVNIQFC